MSSVRAPIFYLGGLNTSGDERLHLGPLALGQMAGPWMKHLQRHGHLVRTVDGRGGGPIEDQIARAKSTVESFEEWRDGRSRVHFLAHSTGGLVARALVHELGAPARIASVTTMATPHRGSPMAELIQKFPERRPMLNRILQKLNYKIDQKSKAFNTLTATSLENFNQKYPDHPQVKYASAVFGLPRVDMSWPLLLAQYFVDPADTLSMNDGLVEAKSQQWGEVIFLGALDHMNQIGYDLSPNPWRRRKVRSELNRLTKSLFDVWQNSENGQTQSAD